MLIWAQDKFRRETNLKEKSAAMLRCSVATLQIEIISMVLLHSLKDPE